MSTMMKNRMGRPPKPAGQARDITAQVRLTRDEMRVLCRTAKSAGVSVSDWLRVVIFGAIGEAAEASGKVAGK